MQKNKSIRNRCRFATQCAYAAASKSEFKADTVEWKAIWTNTYEDAFINPQKYNNEIL